MALGSTIRGAIILISASSMLLACSTTPIPENPNRGFGATGDENPFVPQVSVLGDNPLSLEVFTVYADPGFAAFSIEDGAMDRSTVTVFGEVLVNQIGSYRLQYVAKDSLGRVGRAERIVNVLDSTLPVITVSENAEVTFEKLGYGNPHTEPYDDGFPGTNGVTASDNYDGDITAQILVINRVISDREGDYRINYEVADSYGNRAIPAERLIRIRDTFAPGISFASFSAPAISQISAASTIALRFEDAASIAANLDTLVSVVQVSGIVTNCQLISTGSGTSERMISVSGCQGSGSIALLVAAGAARDDAAVPAPNLTPSIQSNLNGPTQVLNVINIGPVIQVSPAIPSIVSATGNVTFNLTAPAGAEFETSVPSFVSLVSAEAGSGTATCSAVNVEAITQPNLRTLILSNCSQGSGDPINGSRVKLRLAPGLAFLTGLNVLSVEGFSSEFGVDSTAPTVSLAAPSGLGPIRNDPNQSVTISVSYSEPVASSGGAQLVDADIEAMQVSGSNVACNINVEMVDAQAPEIRLSSCTGDGGIQVRVKANAVTDIAGNFNSVASAYSQVIQVDNTAPTLNVSPLTMPYNLCDQSMSYRTQGVTVGLGGTLQIVSESVDFLRASNSYSIVFRASDAIGNLSIPVTRAIHVLPLIRPDGPDGDSFTHGLRSAADLFDANISRSLRSSVNAGTAGENFILCSDIDVAGYATNGISPIGIVSSDRYFRGILEGDNKKILNLNITSTSSFSGLFRKISNPSGGRGEVRNLKLENVSVVGTSDVGALTGSSLGGLIRNVAVSGMVNISGSGDRVGGLVGINDTSGGGNSVLGIISGSYVHGSVSGVSNSDIVGGLAGQNRGDISNSFAIAGISGRNQLGGLVGRLSSTGTISNSYAVPIDLCASSIGERGGLVGHVSNGSEISYSYWDADVSGFNDDPTDSNCNDDPDFGIPKTTLELKTATTFADWDSVFIWRTREDYYPDLLWSPYFN